VRSAECRMQNVEFATIRAAGRDGGTKGLGAMELPKRQTAADGREPGFGGREPAQIKDSTGRAGRPGNRQNPTALGTWNCRSYLT
jgi:hypothetical protein